MTNKINLLFLPYHNTGGHFIDWSIRYLGGQDVVAPVSKNLKNWHQHKSRVANGFQQTVDLAQQLQHTTLQNFENVYVSTLDVNSAADRLYNCMFEQLSQSQQTHVEDYINYDLTQLMTWGQQHNFTPVIFDYCDTDLYSIFYNDRFILDWNRATQPSQQALLEQYKKTFFSTSVNFDNQIWDYREKLALIYNMPKKIKNINEMYNKQLPHLYYTTDDVWNNLFSVLLEIFTVLEIQMIKDKVSPWQQQYNHWRSIHDPYFGRHLDRIIHAIINNEYMRLDRFNMCFAKEVIILQTLIKKHNLNLKNWQLKNFPNNTQDLHKLLEPNIHMH